MPARTARRLAFVTCLTAASLAACTAAPDAARLTATTPGTLAQLLRMDFEREAEAPVAAVAPRDAHAELAAEAALSPFAAPLEGDAKATSVRILGRTYLSTEIGDAADVQDKKVVGGAVTVTDAISNRTMARGVTYYDGSFMVDVPLKRASHAVLVAVDLAHKEDMAQKTPLVSPVVLKQGATEARVVVSPGSTALSKLLDDLSKKQDLAAPGVNLPLANLITAFEPTTRVRFAEMAEASPELKGAVDMKGLKDGIDRYVARIQAGEKKTVAAMVTSPSPAPSKAP